MKRLFSSYFFVFFSFILMSLSSLPAFTAQNTHSLKNTVSDSWITTKIKTQLAANSITKATSIKVETNNRTVTLTGIVDSDTEADTAVQIAASVEDVKDVDASNLTVKNSDQPLQDSYITAKVKGIFIREKLLNNSAMSALNIKVETQNGVVYLSGNVKNKHQADRAVHLAKSINGVNQVISNIKVGHK